MRVELDIKITLEESEFDGSPFATFTVEGMNAKGQDFLWGNLGIYGLSANFSKYEYVKFVDRLEKKGLEWGVV